MTPKPFTNALLAAGYIAILVSVGSLTSHVNIAPDNILVPMGMLGLVVTSVAVMALLFFYQPVTLLIAGDRKGALSFLLRTILYFALITGAFLLGSLIVMK